MSVVPVNFIATDEAIQELVSQDSEWQRLNRRWNDAQDSAKEAAHRELSDHQDELTNELGSSILSGALVPVALKRMGGRWVEHNLPHEYWETFSSDLALWTGKVDPRGLSMGDQWIGESPLCFRREAFQEWMWARAEAASAPSKDAGRPETSANAIVWWSVAQAVAWLVERSELALTRAASVRTLKGLPRLQPISVGGEIPISQEAAPRELINSARMGRITIRGRAFGIGDLEDVPVHSDFRLQDHNGTLCIGDSSLYRGSSKYWSDLWVQDNECRRVWPEKNKPAPRKISQAPPPVPTLRGLGGLFFSPPASRPDEVDVGGGTPAHVSPLADAPQPIPRGAAIPREEDQQILEAMLTEDAKIGSAGLVFSVRDYVLKHADEISGPSNDAKIRRLTRKFGKAKACRST